MLASLVACSPSYYERKRREGTAHVPFNTLAVVGVYVTLT